MYNAYDISPNQKQRLINSCIGVSIFEIVKNNKTGVINEKL